MIDENEIPSEEVLKEPLTKGLIKMPAIDFDTWNNTATVKYIEETGDTTCIQYTTCIPDIDGINVWARVEHDFITDEVPITKEEAIINGMINDEDGE